jgi:hypothetical protein
MPGNLSVSDTEIWNRMEMETRVMRLCCSIFLAVFCLCGSSARADHPAPVNLDEASLDELLVFYVRVVGAAAGKAYVCNHERLAEFIAYEANKLAIITATYDEAAGAWQPPRLTGSASWQEDFLWGVEHGVRSILARPEGCGGTPWANSMRESEKYQLKIFQRNQFRRPDPAAPRAIRWERPEW